MLHTNIFDIRVVIFDFLALKPKTIISYFSCPSITLRFSRLFLAEISSEGRQLVSSARVPSYPISFNA